MDTYYWSTDYSHANNMETMADYLENHMDESWDIVVVDGTYCEVVTDDGSHYALHASGDGDFNNHKIEFEPL